MAFGDTSTSQDTTSYLYTINTDTSATWEEANRKCMENFGKLVTIPDVETQTYLANWLPTQGTFDTFYLGIERDCGDSSIWRYYNSSVLVYEHWAGGQPSIQNKCAVMSAAEGYAWNTTTCDGGAGIICQYDCKRDPYWCRHGSITLNGDTCSCTCESGWTGAFCDPSQELEIVQRPWYEPKSSKVTFDDGKAYCENLDMKLPSVTTQQQYSFVKVHLQTKWQGLRIYVDLKLVNGEWVDSFGQVASISPWLSGHPKAGDDCVCIR
ncbi:L-selectin-like [Glandiceps talaboti]